MDAGKSYDESENPDGAQGLSPPPGVADLADTQKEVNKQTSIDRHENGGSEKLPSLDDSFNEPFFTASVLKRLDTFEIEINDEPSLGLCPYVEPKGEDMWCQDSDGESKSKKTPADISFYVRPIDATDGYVELTRKTKSSSRSIPTLPKSLRRGGGCCRCKIDRPSKKADPIKKKRWDSYGRNAYLKPSKRRPIVFAARMFMAGFGADPSSRDRSKRESSRMKKKE